MLRVLVCFAAAASAYEISATRRAVLARVAAIAPLAAVVPAFAELDYNRQDSKVRSRSKSLSPLR